MLPTMQSTTHLYPINGKAGSVKNSATPWSYRDAIWAGVIVGVDPDPANKEKISRWAKDYWDALHPYSAGGAYVNFMMDEGEDRVRRFFSLQMQRPLLLLFHVFKQTYCLPGGHHCYLRRDLRTLPRSRLGRHLAGLNQEWHQKITF